MGLRAGRSYKRFVEETRHDLGAWTLDFLHLFFRAIL